MIDCGVFYNALIQRGVGFFTGVPDSLLKDFCAYIIGHSGFDRHIIAANEGGAIALACGYHLATGRAGLVYMQNSGQGNAVNPLVSLADPEVYSIPMLLLIGWRGEPGKHDEPQHIKQGRITLYLLEALEIPYKILPDNNEEAITCLGEIIDVLKDRNGPVGLIVRKDTFGPCQMHNRDDSQLELERRAAIKVVADSINESDIVVSTTGKISRELYAYRDSISDDHNRDFLNIGSMGHCSQIALGIALSKPDKQVYCLDGDGAVIMHMGAIAIIGSRRAKNFKHIVFNNGCHDSVGGQPTCGFAISITDVAKACGYTLAIQARTENEVSEKMKIMEQTDGPGMLEIITRKGARMDLGRPLSLPTENKARFMEFLA